MDRDALVLMAEGNGLLHHGKYLEAAKTFRKALDIEPALAEATANRAHSYHRLGDHSTAATQFMVANSMDPEHADWHLGEGTMRLLCGDAESAVTSLNAGIDLDPSSSIAYANRGIAKWLMGAHESARADLATARRLAEDDGLREEVDLILTAMIEERTADLQPVDVPLPSLQPSQTLVVPRSQ